MMTIRLYSDEDLGRFRAMAKQVTNPGARWSEKRIAPPTGRGAEAVLMALDTKALRRLLCERLCAEVQVATRPDGAVMLRTGFEFPDGDRFPIHVSEAGIGGVRLSDRGCRMSAARWSLLWSRALIWIESSSSASRERRSDPWR